VIAHSSKERFRQAIVNAAERQRWSEARAQWQVPGTKAPARGHSLGFAEQPVENSRDDIGQGFM
jgi:hypothetical protein